MTTDPTAIYDDGTLVRVIGKSVSGDAELDSGSSDVGDERIIYSYAGPGEGDDPNDKPYYLLDTEHTIGGAEWAYPEHVEVVKTAAELAARRPPSLAELTKEIAMSLHHGWGDVIEIDRTDPRDGTGGVIYAYGRAANGLRIAFRVRVDEIEETDL